MPAFFGHVGWLSCPQLTFGAFRTQAWLIEMEAVWSRYFVCLVRMLSFSFCPVPGVAWGSVVFRFLRNNGNAGVWVRSVDASLDRRTSVCHHVCFGLGSSVFMPISCVCFVCQSRVFNVFMPSRVFNVLYAITSVSTPLICMHICMPSTCFYAITCVC